MSYFLTLYVAPLVISTAYSILLGRLKYPEDGRLLLKESFIPAWNWFLVVVAVFDLYILICKVSSKSIDKVAKWLIPDKDKK